MTSTASHRVDGFRRQLRKRVPVTGEGHTGFTTIPDGYEVAVIECDVDLERIIRDLGTRAMSNSRGISKYMSGAVIVRVVSRAKVLP